MNQLHQLAERYPDFYRPSYILYPDPSCLCPFFAWASSRNPRIHPEGSIWVAEALSDAETEWLHLHGVGIEEFIDDILDHDDDE